MRIKPIHIAYWVMIYLAWAYLKSYGNVTPRVLICTIPYILVFLWIYYCLRRIQIPQLFNNGSLFLYILSVVFNSLIGMGLLVIMFKGLQMHFGPSYNFLHHSIGGYALEMFQFYSPTLPLLAWESYLDRIREQNQITRLEKENVRNELKYIKTKINPNFLINSLKKIQVEIDTGSSNALNLILKLSTVLDYILYKGQKELVPLKDELQIIKEFLALQKVKTTTDDLLDFNSNSNRSVQVKSLVLLTFIQAVFTQLKPNDQKSITCYMKICSIYPRVEMHMELSDVSLISYHKLDLESIVNQISLNQNDSCNISMNDGIVTSNVIVRSYE